MTADEKLMANYGFLPRELPAGNCRVTLAGNVFRTTAAAAKAAYLAFAAMTRLDAAWAVKHVSGRFGWCISSWEIAAAVLGRLEFDANGEPIRPAGGEEAAAQFWQGVGRAAADLVEGTADSIRQTYILAAGQAESDANA